jgi:hypothetical protein
MAGSYGTLAALQELTIRGATVPGDRLNGSALRARSKSGSVSPNPRPRLAARDLRCGLPASDYRCRNCFFVRNTKRRRIPSRVAASVRCISAREATGCACPGLRVDDPRFPSLRGVLAGSPRWVPLAEPRDRAVWRISVAPRRDAEIGDALSRGLDADWYIDWGGRPLWVAVAGAEDDGSKLIRATIRGGTGAAQDMRP